MNEKQSVIFEKAEIISKNYYSIIRGLKGDKRESITKQWLNELSVLRTLYDFYREKEGNDE